MNSFPLKMLLCAALLGASSPALAEDATVLWTEGEVQVQPAGSDTPQPAQAGAAVPEGSKIVTAEGASVGVGLEGPLSGSAVAFDSASSAVLTNLGEEARIELAQGSVFTRLAKLKKESSFEISTPTAVATARGTSWQQSLDRVEVFEGAVLLKDISGQEETLSPGEAYDIRPDGTYGTRRSVTESAQAAWEAFGNKVVSSPYFNVVNASDILYVRGLIDTRRKEAACGAAGAYPWSTEVQPGAVISSAQMSELKTALSLPPFVQTPAFVAAYLEPIGEIRSGEPVRALTVQLLTDAAENAVC